MKNSHCRHQLNQTKLASLLSILFIGVLGIQTAHAQVQNTTTTYGYDAMGNLKTVTDPLSNVTQYQYDALNRRTQATDANSGVTQFGYNGQNKLTSVTDPRSLVTNYTVDGLGNQTSVASPDTGTTNRIFDPAGNMISSTDAKNQTTTYQYDALNRLTLITYADSTTVVYQYDIGTNAIGRLNKITDSTGTTSYTYDQYGQVLTDVRVINSTTYTTTYTYDSASQLASITYPSGRQLTYSRDSLGRINQITSINGGTSVTLVSAVTYSPTGQVLSFANGAGQTIQYTTDLDGRVTSYTLNAQTRTLGYNAGSLLTSQTDLALTAGYGYDVLNRLTSNTNSGSSTNTYGYTYDAVGNRGTSTVNSATTTYTYGTTNNRLTQVINTSTNTIQSDANGSITNNAINIFTYDAKGRMATAQTAAGTTTYQVNALGQRIVKTTPTATTIFNYDQSGKMIGEVTGTTKTDYVYLNDVPVAVSIATSSTAPIYYIHADQLNTPRLITDASAATVWQWDGEPFGNSAPQAATVGSGLFVFNPRFPGQYFDAETNLNQNYFRDYDSSTGRYNESDLFGLNAGLNTYAYVGGNPVVHVDPLGLQAIYPTTFMNPAPMFPPAPPIKIVHDTPKNACTCSSGDKTFYAPPGANYNEVFKAGQKGGYDPLAAQAAIGHFGTYDFQRDSVNYTFTGAYTDASNFSVGIYMRGAGFSRDQTIAIGSAFAYTMSNNAGASAQITYWIAGWDAANSGNFGACK